MNKFKIILALSFAVCMVAIYPSTEVACSGIFETMQDTSGETLYLFKSTDNSVWWTLTAKEIGFEPDLNKSYILTYDNNGTTGCECEAYDDKFIKLEEVHYENH